MHVRAELWGKKWNLEGIDYKNAILVAKSC